MPTYYTMASTVERRGDCRWPYTIDLSFEPIDCPVGLAEGIGQGVGAITVTVAEALSDTWKKHFEAAGGQWLIPYLEQLWWGTPLPRDEMFETYRRLHGHDPRLSEFWS